MSTTTTGTSTSMEVGTGVAASQPRPVRSNRTRPVRTGLENRSGTGGQKTGRRCEPSRDERWKRRLDSTNSSRRLPLKYDLTNAILFLGPTFNGLLYRNEDFLGSINKSYDFNTPFMDLPVAKCRTNTFVKPIIYNNG